MHLLFLCGCLALAAAAPPATLVPEEGADEAVFIPQEQEYRPQPGEYQEEPDYEDMLPRIPVLLLTPREVDELFGDTQNLLEYDYFDEPIRLGYDSASLNVDSQEQEEEEQGSEEDHGKRSKRQVALEAMNLALSHTDRNGINRPVGRIHGHVDLNGFRNRNNHHTQAGLGLGSVVYRSNNGRHSVGVGAYGTQGRGSFHGYRYRTRPQWGAGIGYRFRF